MNALTLAMERDPKVFSMSNMRDVKDRIVSAFFYTAPHSPACARRDTVVREKNSECSLFRLDSCFVETDVVDCVCNLWLASGVCLHFSLLIYGHSNDDDV